jgi:hypothetical protein
MNSWHVSLSYIFLIFHRAMSNHLICMNVETCHSPSNLGFDKRFIVLINMALLGLERLKGSSCTEVWRGAMGWLRFKWNESTWAVLSSSLLLEPFLLMGPNSTDNSNGLPLVRSPN